MINDRVPITELRQRLAEIAHQVSVRHESVVVTSKGRPIMTLVPYSEVHEEEPLSEESEHVLRHFIIGG